MSDIPGLTGLVQLATLRWFWPWILFVCPPFAAAGLSPIEGLLPGSAPSSSFVQVEARRFDEQFDVFGFSDGLEGASRPDRATDLSARVGLTIEGKFLLTAGFADLQASATRSVQPLHLESRRSAYEIGVHLPLDRLGPSNLLSIELRYDQQDRQALDCIEAQGVIVGGRCAEADFRLFDGLSEVREPLSPIEAKGDQWTASLRLRGEAGGGAWGVWRYGGGFELSRVSIDSSSPLAELTSPFILNSLVEGVPVSSLQASLVERLPQGDPWLSGTGHILVGSRIKVGERASVIFDLKGSYTHRMSYDRSGRSDLHYNTEFSALVLIEPFRNLLFYGGGRALSNYLLGEDAFLYTPVSARFFKEPYGELFLGFRLGI